jgi:hypothetical protein
VIEQQPAGDRADGDGDTDRRGPDADGAGTLLGVEDVGDDGQRLRHDRGTAEAHGRPGPDQLIGGLRVRRQQRGQAEQGHADDQHPAPADPIAHHTEGE